MKGLALPVPALFPFFIGMGSIFLHHTIGTLNKAMSIHAITALGILTPECDNCNDNCDNIKITY